MKIDRTGVGRSLAAAVRPAAMLGLVLALATCTAAPDGTRAASPPGGDAFSSAPPQKAPAVTDPFLSASFPADDPSRDSLPPSILPVVILRGSDYDMGFQYGEQAAAHIDRTREDKWATALQRFRFTKRSSRRLAFVAAGVSNQMSICGGRP